MRFLAEAAVLAGAALALAGCGDEMSAKEPDAHTIEDEMELHTLTLPDGRSIDCILFTKDGAYTSWIAFDCDWDQS